MGNTIAAIGSVAAARQASAMGKYNQQVQNRNAKVFEQQAENIRKKNEFDIARFDQQLQKLDGETIVNVLKSGAAFSGTALNIQNYNIRQGEIEKDVMEYNSRIAESQALERGNFARIQGGIARQRGRARATQLFFQAGSSLLKGKSAGEFGVRSQGTAGGAGMQDPFNGQYFD
tara:strand:+ start:562 stop:1083 length:522 start_codon:yes stop_codon:yes gene_type:complete